MESFVQSAAHCTVCTNLLQGPDHEPLALKCLHTMCKDCYTRLKRSAFINCPFCKTCSKICEVRKDFRTVGLVDAFIKEQERFKKDETCEMCEELKSVTGKCQECNKFMCTTCIKVHRSIRDLEHHSITMKTDMMKELKEQLTTIKSTLEIEKQNHSLRKNALVDEKARLDKEEQDAFKQIDQAENQIIKEVQHHHKTLKDNITRAKLKIWECRSEDEKAVHTFTRDFPKQFQDVSDFLKQGASCSLTKGTQVLGSATNFIKAISPCTSFGHVVFDIAIKMPNTGIETTADVKTEHVLYNNITETKVEGTVTRLRKYGSELWCTNGSVIHIFSLECKLLRTIKLRVEDVSSVERLKNDQLLVACQNHFWSSKLGSIYLLSRYGVALMEIAEGYFTEIRIYQGQLYALDRLKSSIQVFTCSDKGTWTKSRLIQLEQYRGDNMDTMMISKNVYLGSCSSNKMLVYNMQGKLMTSHSCSGDGVDAELFAFPRICGKDKYSNILVMNSGTRRLHRLTPAGMWSMVTLLDAYHHIVWDVIISDDNQHMWSLEGGGKLVKYNHTYP